MRCLFIILLLLSLFLLSGCQPIVEREVTSYVEINEIEQQENTEQSITTNNEEIIEVESVEFDLDNTIRVLDEVFNRSLGEAQEAAHILGEAGIRGAISAEFIEPNEESEWNNVYFEYIIVSEDNIKYRLQMVLVNRQVYAVDRITEEDTGWILYIIDECGLE